MGPCPFKAGDKVRRKDGDGETKTVWAIWPYFREDQWLMTLEEEPIGLGRRHNTADFEKVVTAKP